MIRILALLFCLAAFAVAQSGPASVDLTWQGQAAFVMETSTGLKVLLDPINMGGHSNDPVEGVDVVTVTHEHPDHNAVDLAVGNPTILRGLSDGDIAKIDQTIKGVRIRTVDSFHDSKQGAERGKNAIFVFELPGLKIVHLGDLGHPLDAQHASAIGPVDVLLVPVSGGPTIDPKTAIETAEQLSAKVVIPMHYAIPGQGGMGAPGEPATGPRGRAPGGPGAPGGRGPAGPGGRGGFSLGTVDDFLKILDAKTQVVRAGHTVTLTAGSLPSERTVMAMENR